MGIYGAVFVRREGAGHRGHVAYCFQRWPGSACYGSTEGFMNMPWAPPQLNVTWKKTATEVQVMNELLNQGYDEYKILKGRGDEGAAFRLIDEWSKKGYAVVFENCMDATYHILTAFGCWMPPPSTNWMPNNWFDALATKSIWLKANQSIFPVGPRTAEEGGLDDTKEAPALPVDGPLPELVMPKP
ncbi:hypothetical protein ACLESD_31120 [Pyxidicoccus sp. 3LFB2]